MTENQRSPRRLAIFASGAGTNTQQIIGHFRNSQSVKIALVATNNPSAGVLDIARRESIPTLVLDKHRFYQGDGYLDQLQAGGIDFIILAGFLWKIPLSLIRAFLLRMVNIHPALLPKFGGKGMYGHHVQEAVLAAKESQSGITVHFVDEWYDHGQILFQALCRIAEGESAASLADKIHVLEHTHFPKVVELVAGLQNIVKRSPEEL